VKSEEQQTTEFDLGVRIGARRLIRRSFVLKPGEETVVTVGPPVVPPRSAGPAGSAVPVVATLLLNEDPSFVYRRVKNSLIAPRGTP
jgi:hypothetical protein